MSFSFLRAAEDRKISYLDPMLEYYPPPFGKQLTEEERRNETEFLCIACFQNCMFQFFRLPTDIPPTKKAAIKHKLREDMTHFFETQPCDFKSISAVPASKTKAALDTHLARCFSKLAIPFTKTPSEQSILDIICDFEIFQQRLSPLWPCLQNQDLLVNLQWPIMDEIMASWRNREKGQRLCTLAFEMHALQSYQVFRTNLSAEERKDVQHPSVRRLFWSVAFLYSHLDPKWDQRMEWIDFSLHEYLTETGNTRAEMFGIVSRCMETSLEMRSRVGQLRRCFNDLPSDEAEGRLRIRQKLRELLTADPGLLFPENEYRYRVSGSMLLADVMSNLCNEQPDQPAPPSQAAQEPAVVMRVPAPISRGLMERIDSIGEDEEGLFNRLSLDSVVQEEEEDQAAKKKKISQTQRRKQAKALQAQEIAGILGDLCNSVAVKVCSEYEEIIMATVLEAVLHEAAKEALEEADTILNRAKRGELPAQFTHSLVAAILPDLESALDTTIDCFICLEPLDFANEGIRFITCCVGGSFTCPRCLRKHSEHPLVAETHIVRQTAAIRRRLGIGAFGA